MKKTSNSVHLHIQELTSCLLCTLGTTRSQKRSKYRAKMGCYRSFNTAVLLLQPWRFLMPWACLPPSQPAFIPPGVLGWIQSGFGLPLFSYQRVVRVEIKFPQVLPVLADSQGTNTITPYRPSQARFLWSVLGQEFSHRLHPHITSDKIKGRIIHLNKRCKPRSFKSERGHFLLR